MRFWEWWFMLFWDSLANDPFSHLSMRTCRFCGIVLQWCVWWIDQDAHIHHFWKAVTNLHFNVLRCLVYFMDSDMFCFFSCNKCTYYHQSLWTKASAKCRSDISLLFCLLCTHIHTLLLYSQQCTHSLWKTIWLIFIKVYCMWLSIYCFYICMCMSFYVLVYIYFYTS